MKLMENSTKWSFDLCSSLVIPVGMQASHSPPKPLPLHATVSLTKIRLRLKLLTHKNIMMEYHSPYILFLSQSIRQINRYGKTILCEAILSEAIFYYWNGPTRRGIM